LLPSFVPLGTLKRCFAFLEFLFSGIIHVKQKLDAAYLKILFTRIRHSQAQFLVRFVRSARLEVDKGDPRVGTDKDVSESDVPVDDASVMQLSKCPNDTVLQDYGHRGGGFHPEDRMGQLHRDVDLPRPRIYAHNMRNNVPLQWKKIS
jgi:hypothetical protein